MKARLIVFLLSVVALSAHAQQIAVDDQSEIVTVVTYRRPALTLCRLWKAICLTTHSGSWCSAGALFLSTPQIKRSNTSVTVSLVSLLQKARFAGDFLQREAKAEGAGGHFWHDEVLTQTP